MSRGLNTRFGALQLPQFGYKTLGFQLLHSTDRVLKSFQYASVSILIYIYILALLRLIWCKIFKSVSGLLQIQMSYENAYRKKGCLFKSLPPYTQMPNRQIITNLPDHAVADNSIKTSKYTFYDFVPLNLIVQFSKLPNIYFLIIGIMQMIPQITISGGFPVIFIPLSFVVGVSAIKDIYEDLKRKQSDEEINLSKAHRLGSKGFEETTWESLKIGDVIMVHQNEQVPADIILLQSSEEKLNCFIETKNLDGETNLKYKQVKYDMGKDLRGMAGDQVAQLWDLRYQFKYQRPNPFIYSFTGSYNSIPLDNNNIILRGCSLKITQWVTGVVIYTGVDSKIMLNSNKARQKKSRLQFRMGFIVIGIFLMQMILTLSSALISTFSTPKLPVNYSEIISISKTLFIRWGSWILLFTNFVPISLIVTLQMVKYIQGTHITQAQYLTSEPAEVRVQTSSLNQELGQIQHVFSDKTGTLTRNYMSFKYMVIGEKTYGYDHVKAVIPKDISNVDFHDQQFMRLVKTVNKQESVQIYDMLIAFGLCHNVIIQQDEKGNKRYNASSPDELAFINMAKYCGWEYLGVNSQNQLCIKRGEEVIKYKILHLIQFNSDRKRMSVILQKDQRIFVYCKGADNIILKRLKTQDTKRCKVVNERVTEWSQEGLRTLLFAKRQIYKKDYEKWAKMYASSLSKLQKVEKIEKNRLKKQIQRRISKIQEDENRQSMLNLQGVAKLIIEDESLPAEVLSQSPEIILHRILNDNAMLTEYQKIFIEQYIDELSEECKSTSAEIEDILEREFELIGATAIEDQLQDNVKEAIEMIRRAGIKVWMLTGDKKETAINIGISCGLVSPDMAVVSWTNTLEQTLAVRQQFPQGRECCLVATGQDLLNPLDEKVLLKLVDGCKAVICCRVTPKQKQDMVWLMRKNKCTTLAIGDGANDVNMINTAHVGVGIKGVEGAQAALCSDYAISQFQILRQLLLYHGRECYRKNSQLILFNFYKNLILVLPQLWYGFNNQFSSATIYDPWIYQLYNVVFTSFPIIIYAVYDQQHSVYKSLREPQLYQVGLKNELFNLRAICFWFISPVIYAFLLDYIIYGVLQKSMDGNGFMLDLLSCGMTIFVSCVIISNLKVLVLSYGTSFGLIITVVAGVSLFYLCSWVEQKLFPFGDMTNVLRVQVVSTSYWGSIIASVFLIMLLEVICNRYGRLADRERIMETKLSDIQLPLLGKDVQMG